jgi:hypothetical protein
MRPLGQPNKIVCWPGDQSCVPGLFFFERFEDKSHHPEEAGVFWLALGIRIGMISSMKRNYQIVQQG